MAVEEPSLEEVEARMAPGAFSSEGFLAPGQRLRDVLEADRRTLETAGLDGARLTAQLDELLTAAKGSRLRRARRGFVSVRIEVFRGFQLCPWTPNPPEQCRAGGGVTHASIRWHLRNLRNGSSLSGPGLAVHLVRDHGFFGGPGTSNRVDPLALARVLG